MRGVIALFSLLWMLVAVPEARATLVWSWVFDPLLANVGPTDVVQLSGLLTNDSTAGETITSTSGGGLSWNPAYDTEYQYDWDLSGGTFPLSPGNSTTFLFGHFTPIGPDFSAAPGSYSTSPGALQVYSGGVPYVQAGPEPYSWTVTEAQIPEPWSAALIVLGLVALAAARRRRASS